MFTLRGPFPQFPTGANRSSKSLGTSCPGWPTGRRRRGLPSTSRPPRRAAASPADRSPNGSADRVRELGHGGKPPLGVAMTSKERDGALTSKRSAACSTWRGKAASGSWNRSHSVCAFSSPPTRGALLYADGLRPSGLVTERYGMNEAGTGIACPATAFPSARQRRSGPIRIELRGNMSPNQPRRPMHRGGGARGWASAKQLLIERPARCLRSVNQAVDMNSPGPRHRPIPK